MATDYHDLVLDQMIFDLDPNHVTYVTGYRIRGVSWFCRGIDRTVTYYTDHTISQIRELPVVVTHNGVALAEYWPTRKFRQAVARAVPLV